MNITFCNHDTKNKVIVSFKYQKDHLIFCYYCLDNLVKQYCGSSASLTQENLEKSLNEALKKYLELQGSED